MFETVVQYLEALANGEARHFAKEDRNLAIAALFYRMIAADGVVSPDETVRFRSILRERFHLSGEKMEMLISAARDEDRNFSGLFPFTSIINHECDEQERRMIVSQMRQLAQADGVVHTLENDLIENVSELLKIPYEETLDAAQ